MYNDIKMNNKLQRILNKQILPGSVSSAYVKCGKPNCRCKKGTDYHHGIYYRWTGIIDNKRTTITLSKVEYLECLKRINNYKKLQKFIDILCQEGIKSSPWNNRR